MNQKLIFLPLLAQVLLTAIVFFRMYAARVKEVRAKKIHPQKLDTTNNAAQHLTDSASISENFSNQFEMPVLFYVLMISLYTTQMVSPLWIVLACTYVALRYLHAYIHCGYNKVMHRFKAYAASSIILWMMWFIFAIELFI